MDGYDRPAVGYLPEVVVTGMKDPVVQIVDEETSAIVYTLRVLGNRCRPRVFVASGTYTGVVGEPGTDRLRTITGVTPTGDRAAALEVVFQ